MPAGCEFSCDNVDCEHVGKGLTVTGPWPIGDIDLIIESEEVNAKPEFKEELVRQRGEGLRYSCLNYPNASDVPIVGYMIEQWCCNCKCTWRSNVTLQENETIEEIIEIGVSKKCPKCDGDLLSFDEIIKSGIFCPSCYHEMNTNRWFTNSFEKVKEEENGTE